MIRYWQSGADDFGGPANRALDDGGSDWIAGVTHCFAGVALAGALAANTLAAQIATRLPVDDVIASTATTLAIDEGVWVNPVAPVTAANVVPRPWLGEQHEQASGLYGPPDSGGDLATAGQAPTPAFVPLPWSWEPFDLFVPQPSAFAVEDDAWRLGPVPIVASNALPTAWGFEQHEQATGLRGVPDHDPWPAVVGSNPAMVVSLYVPSPASWWHDEVPAATTPLPVDEEFPPVILRSLLLNQVPLPWRDGDEIERFVDPDDAFVVNRPWPLQWLPAARIAAQMQEAGELALPAVWALVGRFTDPTSATRLTDPRPAIRLRHPSVTPTVRDPVPDPLSREPTPDD